MGTVVRYERSWSPLGGCPARTDRRACGGQIPISLYLPLTVPFRTVPYRRSFLKLFYFLFSLNLEKRNLNGRIGVSTRLGLDALRYRLLISSQEFCSPWMVAFGTSEPRGNGLVCLSNIQRVFLKIFVVQLVSPGHIFRMPSPNCAAIPGMVWFLQYQFCKGDSQC